MRNSLLAHARRLKARLSANNRFISTLRDYQQDPANACRPNQKNVLFRLADTLHRTWYLGFTSFGGPPVHYAIIHRKFVDKQPGSAAWIDEQTYQDIFGLSQALPGPASTKMLFIITVLRAGILPAIVAFLCWSLPGAITMYGLSVGVSQLGDNLPNPVYAMLSGLNAASVGIIALAAVQLAQRTISDRLSRLLVIGGASAGLCYSALWYFPVLIVLGGVTAALWDLRISRWIRKVKASWRRNIRERQLESAGEVHSEISVTHEPAHGAADASSGSLRLVRRLDRRTNHSAVEGQSDDAVNLDVDGTEHVREDSHVVSMWSGILVIVFFFLTFAATITARSLLTRKPLLFALTSNMYLAGTIIFGGGPVVIPLLREYVVQPGWVSSRDFLIGLAVIQSLPGPNFNFAVYLGALAVKGSGAPGISGAALAFLAIFAPGLTLAVGVQSIWDRLRTKAVVGSALRGVNSVAVGMVFTAVYRLWEIGYLTPGSSTGRSLADDPWWVVVAVASYSASAWFSLAPPLSILSGGVLGLGWYAVVR